MRGRVHPRQASTPSSWRRLRTAAVAELATNNAQTTRISVNSTTLFLSTADRIATATPFFTQPSVSSIGGCPNAPAGRLTVTGAGDDPVTMSTTRCVRTAISWATSLIRARDSALGPLTPATRTRITLIGSAVCRSPVNTALFSMNGRSDSVVMSCTGWLTYPPRLRLGSRSCPPSALWLAALAGAATVGWYGPSGTSDSGSNALTLAGSNSPTAAGSGTAGTGLWFVFSCSRMARYGVAASSMGTPPVPGTLNDQVDPGLRTGMATRPPPRL